MSQVETGRPIIQKQNHYRSKSLTSLARLVPCQFTFPHKCSTDTMPCHANWLKWGKAVGGKAPDWAWASGCLEAHNAIDDKLDKRLNPDQRQYEWMNAYIGTHNYLWANGLVRVA